MSNSILRAEEYRCLEKLTLEGRILDVGGSKHSGYHELIKGSHTYTAINLYEKSEPDVFVDIEKTFPFEDETFDHSICLNVMEHIFDTHTAFSEQVRCVKRGGTLVFATPFMHHIHGSPDDYCRYTASTYSKLAEKYNCSIVSIETLGKGFFSLGFQTIRGAIPFDILRNGVQNLSVGLDIVFNKCSKQYRHLSETIPLGYFVILNKN